MKTIPFKDIRAKLTEVANEVEHLKRQYVLTKNNRPALAVIPIEDLQLLEKLAKLFEDVEDVKAYQARKNEE